MADVVFRFNCKDSPEWEKRNKFPVEIEVVSNDMKPNMKYMFQKSRDVALTMDQHTTSLSSTVMEDFNLQDDQSLKETSSEDALYVGRTRSNGKLTIEEIFFEGTLDSSNGHTVDLDLSQLQEYFLFPGQVAVIKGKNSLGKCLTASRVFSPIPLPFFEKAMQTPIAGVMNVLVASGPFTPTGSLDFEPVSSLESIIKTQKPDICILAGPFIDDSNSALSTCPLNQSIVSLVHDQVDRLSQAAESVDCQLIFVASHKESSHDCVYPTPPYNFKGRNCNCTFLSDPSLVSVGGVIFGVTSTDILMHLSKNELARSSVASDRMGRLAHHLLSQRNFYPLYPPDESIPFDAEHWAVFGQMNCSPHVLILPSELKYFIKDVNGTIVINPQHIMKGQSNGFYCKLQIDLTNVDLATGVANSVGEVIKL